MITIPLRQLLDRGVTLEPAEAVAIVQTLASLPGEPSLDNVEVDSDGGARCRSTRGAPTVHSLGTLLDRLLPAAGIPAALRYTVARGTGRVEAPPFASVAEFSHALSRFETSDRAQVIRGLLSRARPRPSVPVSAAPQAVPSTRSGRAGLAAFAVVAALLISALAGYISVGVLRRHEDRQTRTSSAPATRTPIDPMPRVTSPLPESDPQPPKAAASNVPTRLERPRTAAVSGVPDRAVRAVETKSFSPAFSSAGTALFFQTGGAHDASSAIAVARLDDSPADDLRIMKIVDDGARNYHAQPSPDGRSIAFDSDRDGERGVYVANSDGTHVRRISGTGYAALPSWSPDGRRLAMVRGEPDAPSVWNIWIQPIAGGPAQRITHYRYGETWAASWFPDGRRIAYSHEDELTILDLATSRAQHFATPVRGRLVRTPAVSPDGSRVVFQVFRAGVWMLNVRDGSMECVLTDPTAEEFAWAPDGHRFAFHSRRDGEWGVYVLSASSATS
jgi:Tol biopolymer transport system component